MNKRRGRVLLSFATVTALGKLVAPAAAATDLPTVREADGDHAGPIANRATPASSANIPQASHCARPVEVTDEQARDGCHSPYAALRPLDRSPRGGFIMGYRIVSMVEQGGPRGWTPRRGVWSA
jgi:hypothetical protein